MSLMVDLGHLKGDGAGRARVGILQVDHHLGVMILARVLKCLAASKTGCTSAALPCARSSRLARNGSMAEERFEKVAILGGITARKTPLGKFEARVPVRRRVKFLVRFPVCAELVVRDPFFRVFEHFVRFAQFLETCFSLRFLADIGMIFSRQFPVCALDFILGSVSCDAHDFVVILVFHLYLIGQKRIKAFNPPN